MRVDGLLGAQHNLGFSSIVSSAFRLHDQTLAIGQAAGATAAISLKRNVPPRRIPVDAELLAELQEQLCTRHQGGEPAMLWPFGDLEPDHPAFQAANLLAVRKALPLGPTDVDFLPDRRINDKWRKQIVKRSLATKDVAEKDHPRPPEGELTRGEFVISWWERIKDLPEKPLVRVRPDDADADGLPDADDPLPFDPQKSSWPDAKLPADRDGLPDALSPEIQSTRLFNFTGPGSPPAAGFTNDTGEVFDPDRSFGWSRDISTNHRRRHRLPEHFRDTFLFTREFDRWECRVENGSYAVTVCVGDSGYEQVGQRVTIEGQVLVEDETTAVGEFCERSATVEVKDGRLTVELGQKNRMQNTCLNWLRMIRLEQTKTKGTTND